MNKNWSIVFAIGLFFNARPVSAQLAQNKDSSIAAESFFKIRFAFNSGFMWEQRVAKQSVVELFAGATLASATDNLTFFNKGVRYIIEPDVYAQFRNYYNLQRRFKKNKKVNHNSADFCLLGVTTIFPIKNQNYFNLVFAQGWGIQRSLSRKLSFDFEASILEHLFFDKPPDGGYHFTKLEPLAEVSISYIF